MPGNVFQLRVDVDREYNHRVPFNWSCATADCSQSVHVELPLDAVPVSGWHLINIFLIARNTDGTVQRNITRWWVYIDNDKPRRDRVDRKPFVLGDSWFSPFDQGQSKYSEAGISDADFPWDTRTGQMRPVRGIWRPELRFAKSQGLVLIDPALHANPPSLGRRIYEGLGGGSRTVVVDTTQLSDGPHRMLVIGCDPRPQGRNCGVLVVPFLVDNAPDAPTPSLNPSAPGPRFAGTAVVTERRHGVMIKVRVVESSGSTVASGTVGCAARIDNRRARGSGWLRDGTAVCLFTYSSTSRGRRLSGTIEVRTAEGTASRRISVRLGAGRR